jgi:hypothetical protein
VIEAVMNSHATEIIRDLDDVLAADAQARLSASAIIASLAQAANMEAVRN